MNFKTTLILLVLLLGVAVTIFVTRSSSESPDAVSATGTPTPAKLLDFSQGDINQLTIAPADGKAIVLKRDGANWKLTDPIAAPADMSLPGEILSDLSALTSSGTVSTSGADAAATGLAPPRFQLTLNTQSGKTTKLNVGDRSGTGGQLYVQRDGQSQADLVQADVYDLLDKPLSAYRKTKLLDVETPSINALTIERAGEPAIVLDKKGGPMGSWTIEKPTTMPADTAAVSDLLMSLSNLQATRFVTDTDTDPRRYGLAQPTVRVDFGTTQPSTTVNFGMLDVLKQNAYASTSALPGVVQVSAYTVDSFKKSPLDLRDKSVLNIDGSSIASLTIHTVLPATTQPTTRPASDQTVTISRRPFHPASTTQATTGATTGPVTGQVSGPATGKATGPATKPLSQWMIISASPTAAADSKVESLLSSLHPLKVQKYDAIAATQPVTTQPVATQPVATQPATADRYTLSLSALPPMMNSYTIDITDPGNSQPLVGRYNDLTFELDRSLIDQLKADFSKADEPSPNSSVSPNGISGGMPPGISGLPPG